MALCRQRVMLTHIVRREWILQVETDFRRIVPVDEGVANKIKSLVFERMEKNGGMSGGEIESEIIKDYVMSLPPEERAAAGWTLNQISLQEADRLGEYVHQRDPSWNWGKASQARYLG